MSYKDANDIHQSEEFDMALIIGHDSSADKGEPFCFQLQLKFYIILTSRKGLYPKLSLEEDSGTFQIVHSCNRRKSMLGQSSVDSLFNDASAGTQSGIQEADDALKEETDRTEGADKDLLKSAGSLCKEAINYLGYFSSEESLMYDILQEQAKNAQIRLRSIVSQAMIHCRRDILWDRLLIGMAKQDDGKRRRDDAKDALHVGLTFSDFTELLGLVCTLPLNIIDPKLNPFFNLHFSWYQSFIRVLVSKYNDNCRVFTSSDGGLQYVVVIDPKFLDVFIMMSINQKLSRIDLCLVSRDLLNFDNESSTECLSSLQRTAIQALIEEFVGACCYHMW